MSKRADLQRLAEAIESVVLWMRRLAPTQVSSSTVTTLDTLHAAGPLRISELAERESISQPGMTTLVNRLETAGLAERVADATDGRARLVRITDLGRQVLAQRHDDRSALLLAQLEHLDEPDRSALLAALPALERLIAHRK